MRIVSFFEQIIVRERRMREGLGAFCKPVFDAAKVMSVEMANRFKTYKNKELLLVAMALDPRLKHLPTYSGERQVMGFMRDTQCIYTHCEQAIWELVREMAMDHHNEMRGSGDEPEITVAPEESLPTPVEPSAVKKSGFLTMLASGKAPAAALESKATRTMHPVDEEIKRFQELPLVDLETEVVADPDGGSEEVAKPWSDQPCPIKWWAKQDGLPVLRSCASKLFSAPMSSVATESSFSDAGDLSNGKAHSIGPELLSARMRLACILPGQRNPFGKSTCHCKKCEERGTAFDDTSDEEELPETTAVSSVTSATASARAPGSIDRYLTRSAVGGQPAEPVVQKLDAIDAFELDLTPDVIADMDPAELEKYFDPCPAASLSDPDKVRTAIQLEDSHVAVRIRSRARENSKHRVADMVWERLMQAHAALDAAALAD